MSKVFEIDLSAGSSREIAAGDLRIEAAGELLYWVHLGSGDGGDVHRLAELIGLPEAMASAWAAGEALPGLAEDIDSVAVTLDTWHPDGDGGPLHIFLTERACLTYSPTDVPCIDHVGEVHGRNLRFAQSIGFLLFLIVDRLIGDYVRLLQPLEAHSADIDARIYEAHDTGVGADILALKRRVLAFKGIANSTLHVLMQISGRKMAVITDAGRESLAQVYGHTQMLVSSLESLRDMVASSQDALLTINSEKLNETMKVLTLFASVLLPMTVIAGIYGMNFDWIPELGWEFGYFMALGAMAGSAIILLTIFKLKRWF